IEQRRSLPCVAPAGAKQAPSPAPFFSASARIACRRKHHKTKTLKCPPDSSASPKRLPNVLVIARRAPRPGIFPPLDVSPEPRHRRRREHHQHLRLPAPRTPPPLQAIRVHTLNRCPQSPPRPHPKPCPSNRSNPQKNKELKVSTDSPNAPPAPLPQQRLQPLGSY